MVPAAGVRWSFRGTGEFHGTHPSDDIPPTRVRIELDTGATEDAVVGASSAARRHRHYLAEPSD
jgi:hypothetical protein